MWQPGRAGVAWAAWRDVATRDLDAGNLRGLQGFAAFVAGTDRDHWRAIGRASEACGLTPEAARNAFHRGLVTLGGCGANTPATCCGRPNWTAAPHQRDPASGDPDAWDEALFGLYRDRIRSAGMPWSPAHEAPVTPQTVTRQTTHSGYVGEGGVHSTLGCWQRGRERTGQTVAWPPRSPAGPKPPCGPAPDRCQAAPF